MPVANRLQGIDLRLDCPGHVGTALRVLLGRSATPKVRREELSLTQEALADKAVIHRTYLSDIERGMRNVSLINIEHVAAALSLPISQLFRLVERQS